MDAQSFPEGDIAGQEADAEAPPSKRNVLAITCAVLASVGLCCIILAALISWFDPFDWNLIARLSGDFDAAAEAVPEDTLMYFGMDLLQLRTTEIQKVFEAIAENNPAVTFSSPDEALGDLDDEMNRELSFNFTEDILPWVGQYAGIGITDLQLDEFGNVQSADLIFAAAVRDRGAAEVFAGKFREQLESDRDLAMTATEYEGATIFEIDGQDGIAFALYKSLFLVGRSGESIRSAIDAKNNVSFMDTRAFKDLSDQLPAGRIMSGFLTEAMFEEFMTELQGSASPLPNFSNALQYRAAGFALSFTSAGIQVDVAMQFDTETIDEFQQELIEAHAAGYRLDGRLPAETLMFFSGVRPDLSWKLFRQNLERMNMETDLEEAMASFEDGFGFNPDVDLFPNLDGEYILALMPSNDGLLASEGVDLGLTLLLETSNPAGLQPVMDALAVLIEREFGVRPRPVDIDGKVLQEVSVPFLGDVLSYGIVDDLVLLSTSTKLTGEILAGESSLANHPDYVAVWEAFLPGIKPVVYLDMSSLMGTIREGMSVEEQRNFDLDFGNAVAWIDRIAMANRYSIGGTQHSTLIVFVAGMGEE